MKTLCMVATLVVAAPLAAAEQALVADLTGSGRDAIIVRAEDGRGAVVFLPEGGEGFSLHLYPGVGPAQSLKLADTDRDGALDLVVRKEDGSAAIWRGDGSGSFLPPVERIIVPHHGPKLPPDPAALAAARQDLETALAFASRDDLPSTDGSAPSSELRALPAGFAPRLTATGRFLASEGGEVAAVSTGSRPRLAIGEREILIPNMTVDVTVGQGGGFNFTPSAVTIQPNDSVRWTWAFGGHNVVSGNSTTCTNDNLFCSPSNINCGANPTSVASTVYTHAFPSAGVFGYFCRPHCGFNMTGTVTVQAPPAAPGAVPNGTPAAPGVPLKASRAAGGAVSLNWTSSCSAAANNYAVYQGTLPIAGVYNHVSAQCNLGNVTSTTVAPGPPNAYYLVVPESATNEGSYGRGTAGEIPPAAAACKPQLLPACP